MKKKKSRPKTKELVPEYQIRALAALKRLLAQYMSEDTARPAKRLKTQGTGSGATTKQA